MAYLDNVVQQDIHIPFEQFSEASLLTVHFQHKWQILLAFLSLSAAPSEQQQRCFENYYPVSERATKNEKEPTLDILKTEFANTRPELCSYPQHRVHSTFTNISG